jgi:hypothetical protein
MRTSNFACKKDHIEEGRPSETLFAPHKREGDIYGLSVCHTVGLGEDRLLEIGKIVVEVKNQTPRKEALKLLGRADLNRKEFEDRDLIIKPSEKEDDKVPGHLNITGWPKSNTARQQLAFKLGEISVYTSYVSSSD